MAELIGANKAIIKIRWCRVCFYHIYASTHNRKQECTVIDATEEITNEKDDIIYTVISVTQTHAQP